MVVGLERLDLALVPDARTLAVEVERADRRAEARGQPEDRADRLVAQRHSQVGPARLDQQVVRLDAVVEHERIDAGAFARLLVRQLEVPRDVVAGGHVAQRVAVFGDQHESDARAREDARSSADDALDAALHVDAVAVGQLEIAQAHGQGVGVHVSIGSPHTGDATLPPRARAHARSDTTWP